MENGSLEKSKHWGKKKKEIHTLGSMVTRSEMCMSNPFVLTQHKSMLKTPSSRELPVTFQEPGRDTRMKD